MLHQAYGWTLAEIDATELAYLLVMLRVKSVESNQKTEKPNETIYFLDEVGL